MNETGVQVKKNKKNGNMFYTYALSFFSVSLE